MRINVRYLREKDLFEIQAVEKKLRAHFLLSRRELNDLRSILEKALVESKQKGQQGEGNDG